MTGFQAVDGSFHNTRKAAIEHSDYIKQMAALKEFAESIEGEEAPEDESVAEWLYRHRVRIQAAFGQKTLLRAAPKAPRKPRAKKGNVVVLNAVG
jgi:hypothetical protein